MLRETFNLWIPTFFTQAAGLTPADAAQKSALFPLFGGISVVLAGYLSDKIGRRGRAWIILAGLLLTSGALLALAFASVRFAQVGLTAVIGFVLIGPYSYMAGAISLDFGGRQGSATGSGFIDGVGYLGGVLAGGSVARLSISTGWRGAFLALAGVALLSAGFSAFYLWSQTPDRIHGEGGR